MLKIKNADRNCCIVFVAVIAVCSFLVVKVHNSMFGHRSPDLAKISRYLNIRFPEGSVLIGSDMTPEFSPDSMMFARIRFARSHMSAFIKSLPKSVDTSTSDRFEITNEYPLSPTPDWWCPDKIRSFYAIDRSNKGIGRFFCLKMLIDTAKKDTVDLYVHWATS